MQKTVRRRSQKVSQGAQEYACRSLHLPLLRIISKFGKMRLQPTSAPSRVNPPCQLTRLRAVYSPLADSLGSEQCTPPLPARSAPSSVLPPCRLARLQPVNRGTWVGAEGGIRLGAEVGGSSWQGGSRRVGGGANGAYRPADSWSTLRHLLATTANRFLHFFYIQNWP
jgi:hypothetical protein